MSFDIVSISKSGLVKAKARQDGTIGSRRHVNMPGADISLPTFTDADWEDIETAAEEGVDFLAISFIRTGKDIADVQAFLGRRKARSASWPKLKHVRPSPTSKIFSAKVTPSWWPEVISARNFLRAGSRHPG